MRTDQEILELWLSYSPKELDGVCLSAPARLAIEELQRTRRQQPLVDEIIRLYHLAMHEHSVVDPDEVFEAAGKLAGFQP